MLLALVLLLMHQEQVSQGCCNSTQNELGFNQSNAQVGLKPGVKIRRNYNKFAKTVGNSQKFTAISPFRSSFSGYTRANERRYALVGGRKFCSFVALGKHGYYRTLPCLRREFVFCMCNECFYVCGGCYEVGVRGFVGGKGDGCDYCVFGL